LTSVTNLNLISEIDQKYQLIFETMKNERTERSKASLQRVWLYCWHVERFVG